MILNFRTPYFDQGLAVSDSKLMALRYIKGWFFIDLFSCSSLLQYVFLMTDSGDPVAASNLRATKALRLIRLAKLLRVVGIKRILDRLNDDVVAALAPVANIIMLLFGTSLAIHTAACIWYSIGS
eukprot:SAG11_NODE_24241_length_376_cov_0.924188_1_plen_124_part_11